MGYSVEHLSTPACRYVRQTDSAILLETGHVRQTSHKEMGACVPEQTEQT